MPSMLGMSHIEQVIQDAGGVSALARTIGVKPPTVSQWRNGRRPIPPRYALEIERRWPAVSRHDLRPDVFGPAPSSEPAKAEDA